MKNQNRHLYPSIFQTDWYLLRGLVKGIREAIKLFPFRLSQKKVIDYGCGSSPYRSIFEGYGADYIGLDVGGDPDILISADKVLPLPDGQSDLVVSFQVLEHVKDINLYLKEAHRILTPDGALLLSTHGTWLYHPHPQDFRRWTRDGLVLELTSSGFLVQHVWPIAGPLAWTSMLRSTGFVFALKKIPFVGKMISQPLILLMNLRIWVEDKITPYAMSKDNACVYLVLATKKTL